MNTHIPFHMKTSLPTILLMLFAGIISCNRPATKPKPSPQMDTNNVVTTKTLENVLAAFNRHDLDAIMEYFTEDCTFDFPRGPEPWGQRFTGKDQVREGLANRFKGIPDVQYSNDRHFVAGNRGASEWLLTGTTTSGVKIEVQGCDLWEFRDGKILRKDSYWKIVEK